MKNLAFILALFFGVMIFNSSKIYRSDTTSSKTRLDSIMSKKWRYDLKTYYKIMTFNKKTFSATGNNRTWDGTYTENHEYYLTDSILDLGVKMNENVKNFDRTKVGKNTNGKYLVTLSMETTVNWMPCRIFEILKLSDTEFVLQPVFNCGEWVALPRLDCKALPLD